MANEVSLSGFVKWAANDFNKAIERVPRWKLVASTAVVVASATIVMVKWAEGKSWNWEATFKSGLRLIPSIDRKFNDEMEKLEKSLEKKYFEDAKPEDICTQVPQEPWSVEKIMERLQQVAGNVRNGKNTGAIYIDNKELDELILQVCKLARRTNPLHIDLSPLIRQLEAEIVRMTLSMFKGDEKAVGNVTSGGTDSIRHAVFTARERAKALGVGAGWEMVVPTTAHPAFAKAANEYCIHLIKVDVYPQGHHKAFQVNVDEMKRAITNKTILVAGSIPGFPHGVVDDIEAISQMLNRVDPSGFIGLHVDGCLGGFVLPWMEKAGFGNSIGTKFDFSVERVTSISADTHKYGFTEKGTSVVMYRDHDNWRKHQIFVETNWEGGIYATPTIHGSRSGRDIAAAWAVMAYVGEEGYVRETKGIIETARAVLKELKEDPFLNQYLEVMGNPKGMVIALTSKDPKNLNIYDLKKELSEREWYLSGLQKPAGIHLCVTAVHGDSKTFVNEFVTALKDGIQAVLAYPEEKRGKSSDAVMYCTNEKFGESMFLGDVAVKYWDVSGRATPLTMSLS